MESFSLAATHAGAIEHVHIIRLDGTAAAAAREMRIAVTVIVAGWVAVAGLRAYFGRRGSSGSEFDKHMSVDRKDFAAVEYLLRKGRRQLEIYSAPGIKDIRKGSAHRPTKFNYPLPPDTRGHRPRRPINKQYQSSLPKLPKTCITSLHQKQRRISRNRYGLRVSRRLPAKASRDSPPNLDGQGQRQGQRQGPPHSPLSKEQYSAHPPYWGTLYSPSASHRKSRLSRPPVDPFSVDAARDHHVRTDTAREEVLSSNEPNYRSPISTKTGRRTLQREKRFGLADPVAWDVINRTLMQQQRLHALNDQKTTANTSEQPSSTNHSDNTYRRSSQQRAVSQFTRQLEKYADARGAAGKAPVMTPTISEAKASYHTVKPLMPYKDEFAAAGLAVTASEQDRGVARTCHAGPATRTGRPHRDPSTSARTRQPLESHDAGPSETITSRSCSSTGSYVEFSPDCDPLAYAIEPYDPQTDRAKPKQYEIARKRFLSWFMKKSATKKGGTREHDSPGRRGQRHSRGQHKAEPPPIQHHRHRRTQGISRRPTKQRQPKPPTTYKAPTKHAAPKGESCVPSALDGYDQADRGGHVEHHNGNHHGEFDARPSPRGLDPQGRRDTMRSSLLRVSPGVIDTIGEEMETALYPLDTNVPCREKSSSPKGKGTITATAESSCPQKGPASPRTTTESSTPSLPFTAKLASRTASSLQRALDDAYIRVEAEERQVQTPSKEENVKTRTPMSARWHSPYYTGYRTTPSQTVARMPQPTDTFIYVKRDMPPVNPSPAANKPLPPNPESMAEAGSGLVSDAEATQPGPQHAAAARRETLTGKRKNAVMELSKAEEMLRDLDMFLNECDDADINDRDVIKGLQVATHAAADDLFDAYIRHKTGLRIRRFLADLRSFEEMHDIGAMEQRAKERRAESRRVSRLQNRTGYAEKRAHLP
ncbi:hypothetical protein GGS20DRAFT_599488 [Poronia punctata]|nr:hypothetical protein GGS20DRAFT_599488 [Poronia punctata]